MTLAISNPMSDTPSSSLPAAAAAREEYHSNCSTKFSSNSRTPVPTHRGLGYHFHHIRRAVRKIPAPSTAYEMDDSPPTSASASQTAARPWYPSAAASDNDGWDVLDDEEAAEAGDEEDDATVAQSEELSPFLNDIYAAKAPEYGGLDSESNGSSVAPDAQFPLGDSFKMDPMAQAEGKLIVGFQEL